MTERCMGYIHFACSGDGCPACEHFGIDLRHAADCPPCAATVDELTGAHR